MIAGSVSGVILSASGVPHSGLLLGSGQPILWANKELATPSSMPEAKYPTPQAKVP